MQDAKVPVVAQWRLAVERPVPTVAAPKDCHVATVLRVAEPSVEMQQRVAPSAEPLVGLQRVAHPVRAPQLLE